MSVAALEEALEADAQTASVHGSSSPPAARSTPERSIRCPRSPRSAASYGAWLHVDGAYGGLFALCDEGRELLRRDRSRRQRRARSAQNAVPALRHRRSAGPRRPATCPTRSAPPPTTSSPLGESEVGPSPADLSPELTRHFRALRLWLPLQIAGVAAFRAAQSEKLALALYFHARLSEIDGFDPGPAPDLSVVAFRYLPKQGDADEFNERLLRHLQQEGRVMFSGTRIDGMSSISAARSSFPHASEHVDEAIEAILDGVEALNV